MNEQLVRHFSDNCFQSKLGKATTPSGIATSIATSRARRTTKQLTDLDPGNQVPQLIESDRSSPTYIDKELIQMVVDNYDDHENHPLEDFTKELKNDGIGLL